MTQHDVIDTALELHKTKGGDDVSPRLAEEYFSSLYAHWVDMSRPRLLIVEGVLAATNEAIPLPGYRRWLYVELDGVPYGSLTDDALYYNSSTDYKTDMAGFVINEDTLVFTSGVEGELEVGNEYKIVYYSDNQELSDTMQLYIPGKIHLNMAKELHYQFREDFNGEKITPLETRSRARNKNRFFAEASGKTTRIDKPLQPNIVFNL